MRSSTAATTALLRRNKGYDRDDKDRVSDTHMSLHMSEMEGESEESSDSVTQASDEMFDKQDDGRLTLAKFIQALKKSPSLCEVSINDLPWI